jgi:regulatory protein
VTPQALEHWALRHVDRYGSSSANLRRVLLRRVRRVEQDREESFPEAPTWIDDAVLALISRGYLDDRKYADSQIARMRTRGNSAKRIEYSLYEKGIPRAIAREALGGAAGVDGELVAAVTYAKRRRLGPFRLDPEVRADRRDRDLAALGRSGFPYAIARRIVDATDPESLASALIGEQ